MKRAFPILCILLVALATTGRPDKVTLKNGKVLTGTIVSESDDRITLQVSETISLDVRRDQIAKVVRGKSAPGATFTDPPVAPDDTPEHIKRNRHKLACFAQISGPIDSDLMVAAIRRSCAIAAKEEADLVVFEIDTPGGRVDLMLEIVALIERLHP
ncbi:MAG: hypothetical protein ACOC8D_02670, partial [bacterium]